MSRNSASSRAIPTKKLLEEIRANPAMPVSWGKNQPGMQASEELHVKAQEIAMYRWEGACDDAVANASLLADLGVHKQIVNRIVEPFMHARTVVTATDWNNFYALRRHKDAQPEIKALADAMWEAMEQSHPQVIEAGNWHTPYAKELNEHNLQCSTARCARVSYLTHEGKEPDVNKDIALHDKLQASGHWSPFEHSAMPADDKYYSNFYGWKSYRYWLQNEEHAAIAHCSG